MDTPAGSRALAYIIHNSRVFATSYDPTEANMQNAVFREGRRDVGLMIYDAVCAKDGGVVKLAGANKALAEIYKKGVMGDGRDNGK